MNYNTQLYKIKSYKLFSVTGKDSSYILLLNNYFEYVKDNILIILKEEKNMSENDAHEFLDKFFSLHSKRLKDVQKEVEQCYLGGMTYKECAKSLLDKYYKIVKINKYKEPIEQEEVTEVIEKATTSYYHWKKVSSSLFWNFIHKVNKLDLKFNLDTSYINKLDNSLNNKHFILYMETPSVNNKDVEYEFMYSKLLSSVLKVINNKYSSNEIKFYLGIDKNNILKFGYIFNDTMYTIGGFNYKTNDMRKLSTYIISTNKDINWNEFSKKFKTKLSNINFFKKIFNSYLQNYEDINIYVSVIDSNISLVIETEDDDIINKYYINNIIKNNIGNSLKEDGFYINDLLFKNKRHYYIIIK